MNYSETEQKVITLVSTALNVNSINLQSSQENISEWDSLAYLSIIIAMEEEIEIDLKEEKIKYDEDALIIIAKKADGSMRDALSILDQMICFCNNDLNIKQVKEALGIVNKDDYLSILKLIGKNESQSILKILNKILNNGISIKDFIEGLNYFIRDTIVSMNSSDDINREINKHFTDYGITEMVLLRVLELCLKFQLNMKNYDHTLIPLQVLKIKLSNMDKIININQFINSKRQNYTTEVKPKNNISIIGNNNKKKSTKNIVELNEKVSS